MEAYKKRLIEEREQLLKHLGEVTAVLSGPEMLSTQFHKLLLLHRNAICQYLDILTVCLDDALMAKMSANDLGPVHYDHCAICHKPIPLKGMSRIELSDTYGHITRVEGLCQECYLKFYNAIKWHGKGAV